MKESKPLDREVIQNLDELGRLDAVEATPVSPLGSALGLSPSAKRQLPKTLVAILGIVMISSCPRTAEQVVTAISMCQE